MKRAITIEILFTLMYSDWIGRDGCINVIVKEDNVFIAKKLGDVFIPKSLHEIDEQFKMTVKLLYTWKVSLLFSVRLYINFLNRKAWMHWSDRYYKESIRKKRDDKKAKMSVVNNINEEPRFIFFIPKNNRTQPSEFHVENL